MRGIRKFNSSVMDECHNVIDESFLELEKLCSESSNIMVNCIISSVTLYISVVSSSNDVNRSICGVSSICLAAFNATFMFWVFFHFINIVAIENMALCKNRLQFACLENLRPDSLYCSSEKKRKQNCVWTSWILLHYNLARYRLHYHAPTF